MQNKKSTLKFAWIDGAIIRDVCVGDPAELFHADIAKLFDTVVPQEAEAGDSFSEGVLTKPEPTLQQGPVVFVPPHVSPVEFKLLFTSSERIAIRSERNSDPVIDDFFDIVDDQRLTHVDLGLKSTQDALAYLVTKKLLSDERKSQIIAGELQ
jgi:hypothetical protein